MVPLLALVGLVGVIALLGGAKAAPGTPGQLPPGPMPPAPPPPDAFARPPGLGADVVWMKPGEVWSIVGQITGRTMTTDDWSAFKSQLDAAMSSVGGTIDKFAAQGNGFGFNVRPTTSGIQLKVPDLNPPFYISQAVQQS